MTIHPSSRLTLNGALGAQNPKYVTGFVNGQDISGNQMTAAAKLSANGGINWSAFDIADGSLSLHLNAAYQSRVYFAVNESARTMDDGHTLVNGQIAYETPDWSLSFWGANIFNERYIAASADLASLGYVQSIRGTPRTYGVRFRYEF